MTSTITSKDRKTATAMFLGRSTGLFQVNIYWPNSDPFENVEAFDAYEDFPDEALARMREAETAEEFLQAIEDDFDRIAAETYAIDDDGEPDYETLLIRGKEYFLTVDFTPYNPIEEEYEDDFISLSDGTIQAMLHEAKTFYAVQMDTEDEDLTNGSYDHDEAIRMAEECGATLIYAVRTCIETGDYEILSVESV